MKLKSKGRLDRPSSDKQEAFKEAQREETKRLNADIPVSLFKRLKIYVASSDKYSTYKELLIDLLEDKLDEV